MLTRRQFSGLLAAGVAMPGIARADEWPSRPVTIICPFAAGGSTDIVARLLAEELKKKFNTAFVVENRTGASGNIGVEAGARAKPDGYTLTVGTMGTLTTNQFLFDDLKFNAEKDFAPISQMFKVDHVLVVNPKFPVNTLAELLAKAKAEPGRISYGSSGAGSAVHMFVALIEMKTGVKFLHVPYKGSALALNDTVAGHINMLCDTLPSSVGQIEAKTVRPLGITSAKRNKLIPDVPTIQEGGIPDFDFGSWGALLAPAGTPQPIIDKLSAAVIEAYKRPDVQKAWFEKGADAISTTPAELTALIRRDTKIWGEVVKAGNIKV
jgi:tripartite-type tricarboxylate transporter receptor subunit TctC